MYKAALPLLLSGAGFVSATLQVDFESTASIKAAAKDVAFDVMSYYKGNQSGEIPGIFGLPSPTDDPHQYWSTGARLWSTMLDYWRYTGDDTYNSVAMEGLVHQIDPGQEYPFMSPNWTAAMTTSGHGFWGLSAMSAAELEFPNPPGGEPSWIELAQNVFRALEARFAMETMCGGGLRAQVPLVNQGYHLKSTLANAVFLNLGARLGRYTGNQTYAEWADKTWDWLSSVGLIEESTDSIAIHNSIPVNNCSHVRKNNWTIFTGTLLEGAAYMYNQTTGDAQTTWRSRIRKMTRRALATDFPATTTTGELVLVEPGCEAPSPYTFPCDPQEHYGKGAYLRALAGTAQLAPFTRGEIARRVRDSAVAAVRVCEGGLRGRACSFVWNMDPGWENRAAGSDDLGIYGPGAPAEQMNVLSVLVGLLVDEPAVGGFARDLTVGQGGEGGDGEGGDGSQGDGDGSGNGDGSQGNGDGGSAGTTRRVAAGWVVAGLVAALL
ncbi:glycosyl hydrolase family 76-domain-containing protein [Chaetomium fimeti]